MPKMLVPSVLTKNSTTKGVLIYSRLHAGATAVVQLFLLVFTRTILLSITTKSSSAKLYFFFDLAPYCHKKSLESNIADTFYEVLDIILLSDLIESLLQLKQFREQN